MIEAAGFPAVYIGSYATAASRFGLPDVGLLSLDEMAAQAKTVADAVEVPVIADAEGGFHHPANIWRTVRAFEDAGVAAIHLRSRFGCSPKSFATCAFDTPGCNAAFTASRLNSAANTLLPI